LQNLSAPDEFLAAGEPAGALIYRNENGRTYFSVNDRRGRAFDDNEGYFEFAVRLRPRDSQ
jgi:hypothetical protein